MGENDVTVKSVEMGFDLLQSISRVNAYLAKFSRIETTEDGNLEVCFPRLDVSFESGSGEDYITLSVKSCVRGK